MIILISIIDLVRYGSEEAIAITFHFLDLHTFHC
jgi:hypothetical protein